jgi:hypothetical protein
MKAVAGFGDNGDSARAAPPQSVTIVPCAHEVENNQSSLSFSFYASPPLALVRAQGTTVTPLHEGAMNLGLSLGQLPRRPHTHVAYIAETLALARPTPYGEVGEQR